MKNQTWTARVIGTLTATDIAGSRVWLAPGRYVLTELSDLAYEIRADEGTDTERLAETLLVSQVVAYRRTGALLIEGQWP
jgi:hypothetical protein